MQNFSVLELLHPDGIASPSFVLGRNCPENLCPERQTRSDGKSELLILAPTAQECDSEGWLQAALPLMSRNLSDDGVGYVLVAPRWRWHVMRLLRQAGLIVDSSFWHFPNLSSSQYLVPMQLGPARFAIEDIISSPAWKRTLARQLFRYSGTRQLLTWFWDCVGIVVRRPGARPLFEWLFEGERQQSNMGTAVLRSSWKGSKGASIAYGFLGGDALPSMIAKNVATEDATTNLNRESQVLEELGPAAHRAGMRVPKIIQKQQNDLRSSLLLSFIAGRAASDVLESRPGLFSPVMVQLVDGLERWQRATVILRPLTWEQFEQAILSPLDQLTSLQNADRYREWLVNRGQALVGNPVPLVATHNDLTMANVLLDERNQPGLVDWETGCRDSWPMVDFFYAVTDAVRITTNSDWPLAFKACYEPGGSYTSLVAAWRERLQSLTGLSATFVNFCFHACWLHHALNEHIVSRPGQPRPFFEIVQWIALHDLGRNENQN